MHQAPPGSNSTTHWLKCVSGLDGEAPGWAWVFSFKFNWSEVSITIKNSNKKHISNIHVSLQTELCLCRASMRVNCCSCSGTLLIRWFQVLTVGRCWWTAELGARSSQLAAKTHSGNLTSFPECTRSAWLVCRQRHAVSPPPFTLFYDFMGGQGCKCHWCASNWPVLLWDTGSKLSIVIKKNIYIYESAR